MKCVINGIKPRNYTRKDGKDVKGFDIYMLADNADVYGKCHKECFIDCDSPTYMNNYATFNDMDALKGREVNVEWDVEMYGTKAVKRLVSFELLTDFYELVKKKV